MDSKVKEAVEKGNVVVFFDIAIAGVPQGRLRIELYKNTAPRTVENFRQLCTGEFKLNDLPMGYKNTKFHRTIKNFMIQGGDFVSRNGNGSRCIYGTTFEDENFDLKHDQRGLLSMANQGPNSNGCQFFFTFGKCEWLDGKNVVFGKILNDESSMQILDAMERIEDLDRKECTIMECGEL